MRPGFLSNLRFPRRLPSVSTPPTNVPNVPASVNDTARFLAGLPVSEGSPLAALTQNPAWQQHATFFDQAWAKLIARQFVGIRNWEINYLPDATQPLPVAFYMFSGPDFLYAHQFFPNASTYILAGTEPIGLAARRFAIRRAGACARSGKSPKITQQRSQLFLLHYQRHED